jgi:hypothetical protein
MVNSCRLVLLSGIQPVRVGVETAGLRMGLPVGRLLHIVGLSLLGLHHPIDTDGFGRIDN